MYCWRLRIWRYLPTIVVSRAQSLPAIVASRCQTGGRRRGHYGVNRPEIRGLMAVTYAGHMATVVKQAPKKALGLLPAT